MMARRAVLAMMGVGLLGAGRAPVPPDVAPAVSALKITVLSTMLADEGLGEWGYAALVEVDGRRILFDTGAHADIVLRNAEALKVDLSNIETLIISHNHSDHTGGLVALRKAVMARNPAALSICHVGAGVFEGRADAKGVARNGLSPFREAYEALGGRFVEAAGPKMLAPGVWFTGPVPRTYPERNWSGAQKLASGAEDTVPEDSSLVFDTPKGLVVLTGCGHAGVVNICEYARKIVRPAPIEALVGGIHLFAATDKTIGWTAERLKAMEVRHLLAGHCTGVEATYKLRDGLGLTRATAVVSAVGSAYDLATGIAPGAIAA
jgi:7,8-dihydropterin-6-yl-methyl-4-(beta-D-ribofuranosyl)aminobenzene 5'-phosphate synthase